MRPAAAFLDRDGTINVSPPPHEYVTAEAEFRWLAGAQEGLRRLAGAGYRLAVVSNQRGVARGLVEPTTLTAIEARIQRDLARLGCRIDAFRYCVHELDEGCSCRKPKPGMLLQLADELGLDLEESWMIGDAESDVLAGRGAGCRTVRLAEEASAATEADLVAPSLERASELIVSRSLQTLRS